MDILRLKKPARNLAHPVTSHLTLASAANLWSATGGQAGESKPLPAPSLPSLPAAGLTSISVSGAVGAHRFQREGWCQFGGGGYRNMATATYPLRAINLKIISKWTLPILGDARHRQFQGLMWDRKSRKYILKSFQLLTSPTRHMHLMNANSRSCWFSHWLP